MEAPEVWFHRRATLYVEAQILFHLNQAGVFGLLGSAGPLGAPQVAEALRLDPGTTGTLLDYVFEVDDLLDRDADGRYSLSAFGQAVVERFSDPKAEAGRRAINMFDVRVGAYGPVWQHLGRMLSGDGRYGADFHREGRYAENGVFKLAMRFWGSLVEHVDMQKGAVVEVGLTTGLLERVAQRHPDRAAYGLDRSAQAIERSASSAASAGVRNIRFLEGDFFDVERWAPALDDGRGGLLFSLHFHELIARGEDRLVEALGKLRVALPGWVVLAFEQPRLPHADRGSTSESLWLYAQSNVLIHHLIGNGRILGREQWLDLGARAGCRRVTDHACDYLGYRAFAYHL